MLRSRPTGRRPTATCAPIRASYSARCPTGNAEPAELHHDGRADQGFAVVAWPATDAFDLKNYNALRILKTILGTRMTDQLRIQDGVTYSPASILSGSTVAPHYGILLVGTELPPVKTPVFFRTVGDIAADLQAHPVSADELERARKPLIESLIAIRQTNDYWLSALTCAQQDSRELDIISRHAANSDENQRRRRADRGQDLSIRRQSVEARHHACS